ncbi:MAG: DUF4330 domain-containing protein [Ruminococcaceae bacterium]|nr:DUF4330 domain-containing protein [Oscillospiraceae bacterium]
MLKNGKLFGKVSIIDILVFLIIVVAAVAVYFRISATPQNVQVKTEKFSYLVRIDSVRIYTVDGLKALGPIYDKETKEDLGKIVEVVSVEPMKEATINLKGETVNADSPEKYSVVIRIETDGNIGDNGYYTSSNRMIGVGGDLSIESKYVSTGGRIIKIEEK